MSAAWSKRRLPGAWPWRSSPVDDDPDAGRNYFWVAAGLLGQQFDALLLTLAEDQRRMIISAPDFAWVYCPYDGGADVLLPSPVERDALRERHTGWLSSHPRGL